MRQKKAGQNPLDPAGHFHAGNPHALQDREHSHTPQVKQGVIHLYVERVFPHPIPLLSEELNRQSNRI